MIIASQRHTAQTFPGLTIEHGEIRQHGIQRTIAMNGRGIHQTSLRTAEGKVITLPVCRLFDWQA
ncbi:hypothetical protein FNA07_22180 [Salmonella enterica]|nr:hypothetical protein [Salmonella enterica]